MLIQVEFARQDQSARCIILLRATSQCHRREVQVHMHSGSQEEECLDKVLRMEQKTMMETKIDPR